MSKFISAAVAVIVMAQFALAQHSRSQRDITAETRTPKTVSSKSADWLWAGGPEGMQYSPLSQINRSNVKQLAVAWTFDTGETGGLQTTPLIINSVLYAVSPTQKVFALDAATGKLLWRFDSGIKGTQPCRGLAYWTDGSDKRVFVGIMNYLYAIDAGSGNLIATFGDSGRVDLRAGLGRRPVEEQSVFMTSPGIVYKNLIIVGGRNPETLPAPPGDIRAYDVRDGHLAWSFHTIPHPGEFGYDTWPKDAWTYSGATNNWAGFALDAKRGIVYVPTGSAAMDFYGANRKGDDLFGTSLIALDAATGKRIWHFQGVRHDIWDRDFPSHPALVTVLHDGKKIDAIAQTSKQGFVYLFDRSNGKPLFPIEYRKYPASDVPGEAAAAEQGLPVKPAPFARQELTEDMLSNRTPEIHKWAVEQFRQFRSAGQFVPFAVGRDTVVFPGFDGGAEWGGPAVDPQTGIIYVNSNDIAWTGALAKDTGNKLSGNGIYQSQCAVCHGENRVGSPPDFPSLVGIGNRLSTAQIANTIKQGKGRMPGYPQLKDDELNALLDFLVNGENKEVQSVGAAPAMDYIFTGYHRFYDPDGYPAVAPPWGTLNAIDLNTGEYVWKIPLGEYPQLAAKGLNNTGTENYGGPVVTAGGLLFIGATNFDKKFRAFDKRTGQLLWETMLPFSGNATPAVYQVGGREYVVLAAGGGKDPKSGSGGVYVAFALPKH